MLYTIFIIPILIITVGYLMHRYPPKKINWFIGYRTRKSMKNEEYWKLANQYCGKMWVKIGLMMLVIALVLFVVFYLNIIDYTEDILTIIILIQTVIIILPIFLVEKKLKSKI